ncbi:MAG: dihydrolipoyllysine-residue acetyltransferase [Gammaproteobacteria bacterium]
MEIVVPDLGDFSDVEVIECLASPGDEIESETPLITLETDKAAMDVPSPHAGKLVKLTVAVGDRVSAGDVIAVLEPAQESASSADADDADTAEDTDEESAGAAADAEAQNDEADDATRSQSVTVPDLGDFSDVEIIEMLASVGDTVTADQGLFTVETEKAAMDVPAGAAGKLAELRVGVGDKVSAGDVVAVLEVSPAAAEPAPSKSPPQSEERDSRKGHAAERQKPAAPPAPSATASRNVGLPPIDETSFGKAHASPSVRKLARELGVNLGSVQGSGRKQRVTADDVKSYVKQVMLAGGVAVRPALPQVPEVDHAKFGEIETVALTRIQKISGPRLHASWVNLPHVTQHDLADITELEAKRAEMKEEAAEQGVKLTPVAFIMRACALALEEFPAFKSSLTSDGESLVMKHYTHIGFAADTPNGLMVPVVRDADKKSVFELAAELGELSAKARDGKLRAAEMQGGVFTVSSLGGIGGTYFTPIINAPEVAILGVSRSSQQPVFQDGKFVPRLMLPLSLSYDHRVIDGAQAARFTTFLGEMLADVDKLLGKPA